MPPSLRYVPYDELGGEPSVIVDGYGTEGTLLVLSHWPGAGTPPELADDLSTQIVLRALERPDLWRGATAVSNNHFDEDGLAGIWCLLHLAEARAHRAALVDVASFGDFGTYRGRDGARVAMTIAAYADEERSPLGARLRDLAYPERTAVLYEELLGLLGSMLEHPGRFRALWEEEDARLARDEALVRAGDVRIEERPDLDLAVVTVPEAREPLHEAAVHGATARHRILTLHGDRAELRYRYETWVAYVSAPTVPRVDLVPLAAELTAREPGGVRWTFDGVRHITPSLRPEGDGRTAISPEALVGLVIDFLAGAVVG
jgi:hypothetical protein